MELLEDNDKNKPLLDSDPDSYLDESIVVTARRWCITLGFFMGFIIQFSTLGVNFLAAYYWGMPENGWVEIPKIFLMSWSLLLATLTVSILCALRRAMLGLGAVHGFQQVYLDCVWGSLSFWYVGGTFVGVYVGTTITCAVATNHWFPSAAVSVFGSALIGNVFYFIEYKRIRHIRTQKKKVPREEFDCGQVV